MSQLPEKIKKSSDVVSAALRGLKLQDEKLLDRLREEEIKQVRGGHVRSLRCESGTETLVNIEH